MSEMNLVRFREITEAYGADPVRWPEAERRTAQDFVVSSVEAQGLLADARILDDMLDAVTAADHGRADADQRVFEAVLQRFQAESVSSAQIDNVVTFPAAAVSHSAVRHPLLWGVGLGMAACLAGAAFGVNLSLMSLSDMRVQTVLEQVAMIDGDG